MAFNLFRIPNYHICFFLFFFAKRESLLPEGRYFQDFEHQWHFMTTFGGLLLSRGHHFRNFAVH